ncbi:MAG: hypothetical protein RL172_2768 [Bacteroidota bacterium]|jgi:hypothetical protein
MLSFPVINESILFFAVLCDAAMDIAGFDTANHIQKTLLCSTQIKNQYCNS